MYEDGLLLRSDPLPSHHEQNQWPIPPQSTTAMPSCVYFSANLSMRLTSSTITRPRCLRPGLLPPPPPPRRICHVALHGTWHSLVARVNCHLHRPRRVARRRNAICWLHRADNPFQDLQAPPARPVRGIQPLRGRRPVLHRRSPVPCLLPHGLVSLRPRGSRV